MNGDLKLRAHQQAMFWQRLGEASTKARRFEQTMRRVSSSASASPEQLKRLHADALAKAQLGPRR